MAFELDVALLGTEDDVLDNLSNVDLVERSVFEFLESGEHGGFEFSQLFRLGIDGHTSDGSTTLSLVLDHHTLE